MIFLAIILGLMVAVGINGLADNLPHQHLSLSSVRDWLLPRCFYCGETRKPRGYLAIISCLQTEKGCASCGAPHPLRNFIVEAGLGIGLPALVLLGYSTLFDMTFNGLVLALFLLLIVMDFEHRIVLGEVILAISLFLILGSLASGSGWFLRTLAGGGVGFAILFGLYGLGRVTALILRMGYQVEPLGFGDVWIGGVLGLAVGWPSVLPAVLLAIFLGGLAGILLILVNLIMRKPVIGTTMAYGPYLAFAAIVMRFSVGPIIEWIQ